MSAAPAIFLSKPALSNHLGWKHSTPASTLPCGVPAVDALTGGLPRGCLSELSGPHSSGRASLALSALAQSTQLGEHAAYIDTAGSLDPHAAALHGVALPQLLWVRCSGHVGHAFKSADLLLASGGFSLVILDLCDASPLDLRRVPISYWYRFRRAVESAQTTFLVLSSEPQTRSTASLAAALAPGRPCFTGRLPFLTLSGVSYQLTARKPARPSGAPFEAHPDVRLSLSA